MILNWLINIFPTEMRRAWLLVRRDLILWLALFALLSVASVAGAPGAANGGPNLATLVHAAAALLATILPAVLFQAAAGNEELAWSDIFEVMGRRVLPLIAYSSLGVVISLGASYTVVVAATLLLGSTPVGEPMAWAVGSIVLITLLVRFCFLPFFVVLHTNADIPDLGGFMQNPVMRVLFGPLAVSSRLGDNRRWSLTPYVVISRLGPLAVLAVPVNLLIPFLVVWQLFMLTAQAVLFDYYSKGCARMGIEQRPLARPKASLEV